MGEPTPMELPAKWRAYKRSDPYDDGESGVEAGLDAAADELEASIAAHPGVAVAALIDSSDLNHPRCRVCSKNIRRYSHEDWCPVGQVINAER